MRWVEASLGGGATLDRRKSAMAIMTMRRPHPRGYERAEFLHASVGRGASRSCLRRHDERGPARGTLGWKTPPAGRCRPFSSAQSSIKRMGEILSPGSPRDDRESTGSMNDYTSKPRWILGSEKRSSAGTMTILWNARVARPRRRRVGEGRAKVARRRGANFAPTKRTRDREIDREPVLSCSRGYR